MVLAGALPTAQGLEDYCNFESPQVKPITVATIETSDFLIACNTPDNSLEVFDITGSARDLPVPVARIPVGLEPVSVVYAEWVSGAETKRMLYSVNWLGDTVTYIEVFLVSGAFQYVIRDEVKVTDPLSSQSSTEVNQRGDDEPMHLAFVNRPGAGGQYLVVSKRAASSCTLLDPLTGAVMGARKTTGQWVADGGRNVIMTSGGPGKSLVNGQVVYGESLSAYPGITHALKEPHAAAWRPGTDQFWVLGHKGGGSLQEEAFHYDFDIWGVDMPSSGVSGTLNTYYHVGGLGQVNFNMAFDPSGDYLYVVGTESRDQIAGNGHLVTDFGSRTGFVKTFLYKVKMSDLTVVSRNLNLDYPPGNQVGVVGASLSHATDVAICVRSGQTYAIVAGFNSARLGVVRVDDPNPKNWTIERVDVEATHAGFAGPRGVAVLSKGGSDDRYYTLNRLDSTITVVTPSGTGGAAQRLAGISLQRPAVEPAYVRDGRKFLYSSAFSGQGLAGFASCASCHVDGRSDNTTWLLTAGHDGSVYVPISSVMSPPPDQEARAIEVASATPNSINGFPFDLLPAALDANNKGPMFTQTLQGLSNFEVGGSRIVANNLAVSTPFFADEGDDAPDDSGGSGDDATGNAFDDLVSNAPYHWRGDKENFRQFNEAFVNLMGMAESTGSIPPGGLTTQQMRAFERFVNSIHFPPNPLQEKDRSYSGAVWGDGLADSIPTVATDIPGFGSEGQLGLKLFHIVPLGPPAVGRSCVQCHGLPEGSNNRVTDDPIPEVSENGTVTQYTRPIETASLRGLRQKEATLRLDNALVAPVGNVEPGILTGDFGLAHTGRDARFKSINGFMSQFNISFGENEKAITQYLRELDSGVAPVVGLTSVHKSDLEAQTSLVLMEAQAKLANCGIAVYVRALVGGVWTTRGYWYDVGHQPPLYKLVGSSTFHSRAQILALLAPSSGGLDVEPDDLVIFRSTPLGSDRRIASFGQATTDLPFGPHWVPSTVRLKGTTPNTANRAETLISPPRPPLTANWDTQGPGAFVWGGDSAANPLSLQIVRSFQAQLGPLYPGQDLAVRHDYPRRLQVTANGLEAGALLRLTVPNLPVPNGATGPASRNIELPLYATTQVSGGKRVWETEMEFDPRSLYTLMAGGPAGVVPGGDPEDSVVELLRTGSAEITAVDITVQAANLPHTTWSAPETVEFRYKLP